MRYNGEYNIKGVIFKDDRGKFTEAWNTTKLLAPNNNSVGLIAGPRTMANIPFNYIRHGAIIMNDDYFFMAVTSTNIRTEVRRTYFNMVQVFSAVGGLLGFMVMGFNAMYSFYNGYRLLRYIVLYAILGRPGLYPKEYQLKQNYRSAFCSAFCEKICCKACANKKNPDLEEKKRVLGDCFTLMNEKMDLKNYLHDSMDFMAIKQLLMKSRHKMLMPALILNITRNKTKVSSGYKTTFARNLHERVDKPVFTLEEAVTELKNAENSSRPKMERNMDEFFLTNLPERIIDMVPAPEDSEVDTMHVSRYANQEHQNRKVKTHKNFDGQKKASPRELRNQQQANLKSGKKGTFKPKSDYTLGLDSIESQIKKKKKRLTQD